MRRHLLLQIQAKRTGQDKQVRLFEMTDDQAELFEAVVAELSQQTHTSVEDCFDIVQGVVCNMLLGTMPPEHSPTVMFRLRLKFPILKPAQLFALPRAGCPDGWIEAVVLQVKVEGQPLTVLFDFDMLQADFFNEGIETFQKRNGDTRDLAWQSMIAIVGRLSSGAPLLPGAEFFFKMAGALFPPLSPAQVLAMPLATEEDVRRWCYR